jgi:hypothetical protein
MSCRIQVGLVAGTLYRVREHRCLCMPLLEPNHSHHFVISKKKMRITKPNTNSCFFAEKYISPL